MDQSLVHVTHTVHVCLSHLDLLFQPEICRLQMLKLRCEVTILPNALQEPLLVESCCHGQNPDEIVQVGHGIFHCGSSYAVLVWLQDASDLSAT